MDYEMIKQLAKEMGCKVTDLIPLAPQNDPFYTGTPSDWALAEWFAHLWRAFGYQERRITAVCITRSLVSVPQCCCPMASRIKILPSVGIRLTWLLRRLATCNWSTLPLSVTGAMMTRWSMLPRQSVRHRYGCMATCGTPPWNCPIFPKYPSMGQAAFKGCNLTISRCGVRSPP